MENFNVTTLTGRASSHKQKQTLAAVVGDTSTAELPEWLRTSVQCSGNLKFLLLLLFLVLPLTA